MGLFIHLSGWRYHRKYTWRLCGCGEHLSDTRGKTELEYLPKEQETPSRMAFHWFMAFIGGCSLARAEVWSECDDVDADQCILLV